MRKPLLVCLLVFLSTVLAWCNNHSDDPDFLFSDEAKICEDNGWEIVYDEKADATPMCYFLEAEGCSLASIGEWDCEWLNHEPGGEWLTVATAQCEEEWWEVQYRQEWGEDFQMCIFDDESFCDLYDLVDWSCGKWDIYYSIDLYPYAEQACIDNNGQISQTEDGEDICILSDDEFCYMSDVMDWGCDLLYQDMVDIQDMHEDEKAYQEYIAECYQEPQITVCGKDGNPYYNRCFMEKAGVEEDVEAEVTDDWCVWG